MNCRNTTFITALTLGHLFLALPLLTSQLLPSLPVEVTPASHPASPPVVWQQAIPPVAQTLLDPQLGEPVTITADSQEKHGDVYTLKGKVIIEFRDLTLRADDIVYDRQSGEIKASGNLVLDGGPNDEHLEATHGTFNARTRTGTFYEVIGTTGARFTGRKVTFTSTQPFTFTGKVVEKVGNKRYIIHHGSVTSCALPTPKWTFNSALMDVDLEGDAVIHNATFRLGNTPVFYLPYVRHPADSLGRSSGFLLPVIGQSSTKGTIIGDSYYWAINRSMDATIGAQYYSDRGWSQMLDFRARPGQTSNINFRYFGVVDRGVGKPKIDEGGQDIRLNMDGYFPHEVRGVVDIEYLSTYLFRQAFAENYSEAVNSEVKSTAFLSKNLNGTFLNIAGTRYQNYQSTAPGDLITIAKIPSLSILTADHRIARTPLYWSVIGAAEGVTRREPSFKSHDIIGRFDIEPHLSLPLYLRGWTLRPEIGMHDTYYSQQKTAGPGEGTPLSDNLNRRAIEASFELRPPTIGRTFDFPGIGRKMKHTLESRLIYHIVNGVSNFNHIIRFDSTDILSNTNELEYALIQRFYFKPLRDPCKDKLPTDVCDSSPHETITWEIAQRYYFDPFFGGALVNGKRNVLTTTVDFAGIAFLTDPRRFSPIQNKLRVRATGHVDFDWELDYDTVKGQINSSNVFTQFKLGDFFAGGGHTFFRAPGEIFVSNPIPGPTLFDQFRMMGGYGGPNKRGYSAAASVGFDTNVSFLQFMSVQQSYNWDCCGLSMEYRKYELGAVRNENQFRFAFTLANIGNFGNIKRQEKLY
jgi:LPS-assembly protein